MAPQTKTISLALQGGGAHGAFIWGALDRLLEEERLDIEAISGTSAGAMNAAMLKSGFLEGGRAGARARLARFWGHVRDHAAANVSPVTEWLSVVAPGAAEMVEQMTIERAYQIRDSVSRAVSPYDWNPFNYNHLRNLLEELIDFGYARLPCHPHLFISATNVRTGKIRVVTGDDLSIDILLASACLPDLFQAVTIGGEAYWDGGFHGNPALFPLFYNTGCRDIVIVHVNPIFRD